ncbi:hypothetical protein E2C01_044249 [Portunus trituberculatus]|uniref:Uncharacterized protein n=1 Tax=Portunus trituberculatus TaxID=210409 RepID=A0A5B7FSM5_PORTR|nr:hypothetical protein [Portunus trituberculatus]
MSVVEEAGLLKARATDFSIAAIMGAAAKMTPSAREVLSSCDIAVSCKKCVVLPVTAARFEPNLPLERVYLSHIF